MRLFANKVMAALSTFVLGVAAVYFWNYLSPRAGNQTQPPAPVVVSSSPPVKIVFDGAPESLIRKIDFANFTYPTAVIGIEQVSITGGETPDFFKTSYADWNLLSLGKVIYADLTNDGEEDALVEMFWQSSPSGGNHLLYLFTMRDNRPKRLWTFITFASGTDIGGIKDMYAREGELVLELYGKNKLSQIGSTLAEPYKGDLRYDSFTRMRFHWNGKKFTQKGKIEIMRLSHEQK